MALRTAGGNEFWSAAACCRFPPASLLAASSAKVRRSPTRPASWPQRKRQQAAALQSFAAGADNRETLAAAPRALGALTRRLGPLVRRARQDYDRSSNMARVQNANTNGPCPNWALNTSTNQLTTSPCSYDAAGDLTGDGSYTYSWNAEQHLTSAANVTHTYDGDLRRVKKSSGTLYWYCAVCGNVLAESDLSGNLTSEYAFFNKQRIARRDVSSGNV